MSSTILEGIYFSEQLILNSGLKILSKPCCKQICCHPAFIEHSQSRLSLSVKNLLEWQINTDFNLKLSAALATNKRVSLAFEA